MSDPSDKMRCPDCSMMVQRKNIVKHYRRRHPGLDAYRRIRETRMDPRVKRSRFEMNNSWIAGILVVAAVVTMMVVASLVLISFINEGSEGLIDERTIFFSASDGAVINATWYESNDEGAPTIYLIHDIGEDRTVWDDYAPKLQSSGYNVMAIDTRGHGESTKSITDPDLEYDHTTMDNDDFKKVSLDISAAYNWVHGDDLEGEPNSEAGEKGAFIGIGKGGQYAMDQFARMSREKIMAGVILSPTLDNLGLDVLQVHQNWGDIRTIILAASEGDGTGKLAIDTILKIKEDDEEENGIGVFVPGTLKGIDLIDSKDLRDLILLEFERSFK